jgi:hypothetical protein
MLDLRNERMMPIDVVALQASESWALMPPSPAKAMLNLWMKAWHQVPAGTLPIDVDVLCAWADCAAYQWEAWQHDVLYGWRVDPELNRFYHPRLRGFAQAVGQWRRPREALEGPWGPRAGDRPDAPASAPALAGSHG